ncbi:MAG: hypothetical protein AB7V42_03785 [Thermoleophilia bacterium]
MSDRLPDDLTFRTLAAPWLEEDDLLAALEGMPVPGALWGDGRAPLASRADDRSWDDGRERRRRHEDLLRKWEAGPHS